MEDVSFTFDTLEAHLMINHQDIKIVEQFFETPNSAFKQTNVKEDKSNYFPKKYIYDNCLVIGFNRSLISQNIYLYFHSEAINTPERSVFKLVHQMFKVIGCNIPIEILEKTILFRRGDLAFDIFRVKETVAMENAIASFVRKLDTHRIITSSGKKHWNCVVNINKKHKDCSLSDNVVKGQLSINIYDKMYNALTAAQDRSYWLEYFSRFDFDISDEDIHYADSLVKVEEREKFYEKLRSNGQGVLRIEFKIRKRFFTENKDKLPKTETLYDFLQRPLSIAKFIIENKIRICFNTRNSWKMIGPYQKLYDFVLSGIDSEANMNSNYIIEDDKEEIERVQLQKEIKKIITQGRNLRNKIDNFLQLVFSDSAKKNSDIAMELILKSIIDPSFTFDGDIIDIYINQEEDDNNE